MMSHAGLKPFKCEHCDKCFPTTDQLKRHAETHNTTKDISCEQVGFYDILS